MSPGYSGTLWIGAGTWRASSSSTPDLSSPRSTPTLRPAASTQTSSYPGPGEQLRVAGCQQEHCQVHKRRYQSRAPHLLLLRREEPNQVAISLITEHIKMKVGGRGGPVTSCARLTERMQCAVQAGSAAAADTALAPCAAAAAARPAAHLPQPAGHTQQLPDPGHAHYHPGPHHLLRRLRLLRRPPAAPGRRSRHDSRAA